MKGKAVIVVLSLLLFVAAAYLYFTKASTSITIRADAETPKITILGYEFYRFKDDLVVSRLAGERAQLFDAGRVDLTEGVRAVRINGQRREELSAKRADLFLASSTQGSLNAVDRVDKIHVSENVDLMVGEARMETEDAVYTEADTTIRSTVPVRVDQTGQFLAGEHGFEFNTKLEALKMKGGITGTILPASIHKNAPIKGTNK